MRVVMHVVSAVEQQAAFSQVADDPSRCLEHGRAFEVRDVCREPSVRGDGLRPGNAGGAAHRLVVFAERRGEVHDARAVAAGHERRSEHAKGTRQRVEVGEHRDVGRDRRGHDL